MFYLFLTPPATGKSSHAEALKKYLKMDKVIEAEELARMSLGGALRFEANSNVLVLGTPDEVGDSLSGLVRTKLSRAQCNEAMVAVGGHPIWNDDGSRFEVKA